MTLRFSADNTSYRSSVPAACVRIRDEEPPEERINPAYFNPLLATLTILGGLIVLGFVIAFIRDRQLYAGRRDIAPDAKAIAKEIKGQVFRDGEDIVISGSASGLRLVVRFGYGENTPGVNIRMDVPANFQMSLAARGKEQLAGRSRVQTNDAIFDSRYSIRSDDPKQAELFLGSTVARGELASLCCTSMAFVTIGKGVLEQSELVIPQNPGRHIINHVRSMQKLLEKFRQMPFAESVVLAPVVKERRLLLRTFILVGIVVAAGGLYSTVTALRKGADPVAAAAAAKTAVPDGIPEADANLIPALQDWSLVSDSELDPDAVAWLKSLGVKAGAIVHGDYSGEKNNLDVAYLLKNEQGQRRLVIIASRKVVYDTKYATIGILVKIPKENLQKVEWASRTPEAADGDAVVFTRTPHDLAAGLVLYFSEGRLVSGVPKSYQAVDVQE